MNTKDDSKKQKGKQLPAFELPPQIMGYTESDEHPDQSEGDTLTGAEQSVNKPDGTQDPGEYSNIIQFPGARAEDAENEGTSSEHGHGAKDQGEQGEKSEPVLDHSKPGASLVSSISTVATNDMSVPGARHHARPGEESAASSLYIASRNITDGPDGIVSRFFPDVINNTPRYGDISPETFAGILSAVSAEASVDTTALEEKYALIVSESDIPNLDRKVLIAELMDELTNALAQLYEKAQAECRGYSDLEGQLDLNSRLAHIAKTITGLTRLRENLFGKLLGISSVSRPMHPHEIRMAIDGHLKLENTGERKAA